MQILNLSNNFRAYDEDYPVIKYEKFFFSAGEPHIKIDPNQKIEGVIITTRIRNGDDFLLLKIAVDALLRINPFVELSLVIPYLPGSRQDRINVIGEALTVSVYADLINSMGFSSVFTFDCHSDVGPALINNCTNVPNHEFIDLVLGDIHSNFESEGRDVVLISPDAGSNKKMKDLLKYFIERDEYPVLVKCDKTRNPMNGEISGFEVYADDLKGKPCLIVDDICDGGGTFIGLAAELKKKNAGNLYLAVTHGIFSKGFDNGLAKNFTHIYCTDSFDVDEPRFCTVIKISDL